jgi:acetolactate synthase I/II/III large subunit
LGINYDSGMTGAEYIAEFLRRRGSTNIFLITGGACAFIVDAIGRNPGMKYTCFQHEQAAAMAADSLWRTNKIVGATVVTSGPGATNLITGIACSFFDSIPTLHITGQVNQNEELNYKGAKVRQAGFQETNIVEMVKPITKYAVKVTDSKNLKHELCKAYSIAISGRMGPVLVDIPMDVQQADVGEYSEVGFKAIETNTTVKPTNLVATVNEFFSSGERPLVLFGAGVGLAGAEKETETWLIDRKIPFVSSWNGMTYFNHETPNYCGNIGVYGNRGANFLIQNCDRLLVLGSRLDNRQRSGNASSFAKSARVLVIDIDDEELTKYQNNSNYETGLHFDLSKLKPILVDIKTPFQSDSWVKYWKETKEKYFGKIASTIPEKYGTISPLEAVRKINSFIPRNSIVVADDGANLCWVFQSFFRTEQTIYTAGGNSPMGYAFPASIGAAIYNRERRVIAFTGDGSMQMNIQDLQTMKFNDLDIKLIILNNFGYGIIKQFQDLYFNGRHHATGEGYSQPDFGKLVDGYGIEYHKIKNIEDLSGDLFSAKGPAVIDIFLHPDTMIEPKLEMGRSIEDQFPYLPDEEFNSAMKFGFNARLDVLGKKTAPEV